MYIIRGYVYAILFAEYVAVITVRMSFQSEMFWTYHLFQESAPIVHPSVSLVWYQRMRHVLKVGLIASLRHEIVD